MIETYKIVSGKYDSEITPTLTISDIRISLLEVTICDFRSLVLNMTCVSFTLLTWLLTTGIVCRIG